MGCGFGQGFYFYRPLDTAGVWGLLSAQATSHDWHVEPVTMPALRSNGSILTHATL